MPTKLVKVGAIEIGAGLPLAVIAGPCVIESRDSALRHAAALVAAMGCSGTETLTPEAAKRSPASR